MMKKIKNRWLIGSLNLVLMVYLITTVLGIPPLPETYEGYAVVNGSLVSNGTSILIEVSDTGEVIGNTTTDENGQFLLVLAFSDTDNSSDGLAYDGNKLKWGINNISTIFPGIEEDTASSGTVNTLFLISTEYPPVVIAESTPETPTPGVFNGTNITFTGTVVAPYPELVKYNWTLDGIQQSNSSSWTYTAPGNESGTKIVTLNVTDGVTEDSHTWNLTIGGCSGVYPLSGDWNITSDTYCVNVEINLSENANLHVFGDVTLEMENVTLILDNGSIIMHDEEADGTITSILNTIIDWIT